MAEKTTSTLTEKSAELMSASAEYFGQIPAGAENGIDPAVLMGIVAQACGWTQEAVSYTHLDVYKRQPMPDASIMKTPGRIGRRRRKPERCGISGCGQTVEKSCLLYTSRCV